MYLGRGVNGRHTMNSNRGNLQKATLTPTQISKDSQRRNDQYATISSSNISSSNSRPGRYWTFLTNKKNDQWLLIL